MNRRELFKSIAAVGGAVAAGGLNASAQDIKRYGFMSVEGHYRHRKATGEFLRVLVDGHDVTDICVEADDIKGYAHVQGQEPEAHAYWESRGGTHVGEHGYGCVLKIRGDVRMVPGQKTCRTL